MSDDEADLNPEEAVGMFSDEVQAELYDLIVDAWLEQGESPAPADSSE